MPYPVLAAARARSIATALARIAAAQIQRKHCKVYVAFPGRLLATSTDEMQPEYFRSRDRIGRDSFNGDRPQR
jgi:hypothetical protein